jgi:hypothetical protein
MCVCVPHNKFRIERDMAPKETFARQRLGEHIPAATNTQQ